MDEVVLGFGTRGYAEIKAHLQDVAKKLSSSSRRIRFVYLDGVAPVPQGAQETRNALNVLIQRHEDDQGLFDLMGGLIHSRCTGLLLEMRTLLHYHNVGYQILQSGREFFDAKGFYVTELDAVVRSPEGKTILVEAKSARRNTVFRQFSFPEQPAPQPPTALRKTRATELELHVKSLEGGLTWEGAAAACLETLRWSWA
ncbi:MAG: hypothetical protein KGI84_05920 [Elusimicrobia bacterium]|nr:hypothetical protein [Elusimicrobiota bacterium]